MNMKSGATAATAAAFLALAASSSYAQPAASMGKAAASHCYGVNSCKGTSDCKTAKNACKGLNACKGQGFKEMTKEACATAGGSLTEKK